MNALLLVGMGGAVGAISRYLLMSFIGHAVPAVVFPYGTFAVNVIGSLFMGLLIGILARYVDGGNELRLFIAVGVLGGFTTFSAFSLDAVTLIERGEIMISFIYILSSVIFSVAGLFAGLFIMRMFN